MTGPTRDRRESLASTKRAVAENTRAGQSVGRAVGAVDGNGDKRTYKLVAADSPNNTDFSKFDINESTGQILTKEPLNHEAVVQLRRTETSRDRNRTTAPTR